MKKHFCNLGEISEKIKNIDPHNNMKYSTWDDVTYGTLFADTFKNCSRYNVTSKGWYVYNGIFWEHDADTASRTLQRRARPQLARKRRVSRPLPEREVAVCPGVKKWRASFRESA